MVASAMPRWNMSVVYPSLESEEFRRDFDAFREDLTKLEAQFNADGIDKGRESESPAELFEGALGSLHQVMERGRTINAYIHAFVTTDTRDETAQAADSEMDREMSKARKLVKRLTGWIGTQDVDALLAGSATARQHEYMIRKARVSSERMLEPSEEALVSDLELTGKNAWSRLHSNVTSQIDVQVGTERQPMSAVRALAYDANRDVRRAAYDAELAAWKKNEVPLAAAMNSIKAEVNVLSQRRGWQSPLEEACFNANIDTETLEAMMSAARESFPVFRRYLQAKAKALGTGRMGWYDLFAPLGGDEQQWEYGRACQFVVEQFGSYSSKLSEYARRAFEEDWIDAPPAPGKVDGAYCMGIRGQESRILMNFKPAFGSVSTLAHELGHGYHNFCLAERTWSQRATPMTLAETASIFCETIIRQAVLEHGSQAEQLTVLEASLQGSCQVVVDITSRFLFESAVFEQRDKRELSASEMCELMLDAQRQTYGELETLHPYMWAVKGHYYSGRSFYNFPYMFGLLFGLGLYAVYRREPQGFHERYDELLSSTGLADAWTLGQRFGIDIRSTEFWRASLGQIAADVQRFVSLVA